jgi:hypothetical protein
MSLMSHTTADVWDVCPGVSSLAAVALAFFLSP